MLEDTAHNLPQREADQPRQFRRLTVVDAGNSDGQEKTPAEQAIAEENAKAAAAHKARFAMSTHMQKRLKGAAEKAIEKLASFVESDEFEKASVDERIRVTALIFDRAYGKNETASAANLAEQKIAALEGPKNDAGDTNHRNILDQMHARHQRNAEADPSYGGMFPELRHAQRAKRVQGVEEAEVISDGIETTKGT